MKGLLTITSNTRSKIARKIKTQTGGIVLLISATDRPTIFHSYEIAFTQYVKPYTYNSAYVPLFARRI